MNSRKKIVTFHYLCMINKTLWPNAFRNLDPYSLFANDSVNKVDSNFNSIVKVLRIL